MPIKGKTCSGAYLGEHARDDPILTATVFDGSYDGLILTATIFDGGYDVLKHGQRLGYS